MGLLASKVGVGHDEKLEGPASGKNPVKETPARRRQWMIGASDASS
jgi:hypothetical protein